MAFFAGGVFTVTAEWCLLLWSDKRDIKRHGQTRGDLIHDDAYEADAVRRDN